MIAAPYLPRLWGDGQLGSRALFVDPILGRIAIPKCMLDTISLPGRPTRRLKSEPITVWVCSQQRPEFEDGKIARWRTIWHSIFHNDRVNDGGEQYAFRIFGRTPTVSATNVGVFTVIAVATTGFTAKTATDRSIGSATAAVTTNEFTAGGLARAAGTLGAWTAQAALNGQFSQVVTKAFSSTATQTAHGVGQFDSATVVGSNMAAEDTFAADAALVNLDTLNASMTNSN